MIYSGIPHPTAALFLSGNFVDTHERIYILTDDKRTKAYIQEVGSWIWDTSVRNIEHPGELFMIEQYDEKVYVIHTDILRLRGNLESIKRTHTIELQRDTTHPQNTLIESLLEYGYQQSNYRGESLTYNREGSIIRIYREDREYLIEYFDDTIESIIETTPSGKIHRKSLIIPKALPSPSDTTLDVSKDFILSIQDTPTIMLGCEFLKERDFIIAHFRDIIEFSSISREGAHRLSINVPKIESLPDFQMHIREREKTHTKSLCITRYEKKLQEFIDMNPDISPEIHACKHLRESFILEDGCDLLGEKWSHAIEKNQFSLFSDDIFSQIFVQNRVRKSTIKNLDLLLHITKGDLVVHREHGIGRYIQILEKRIGLIQREYMEIEYRAGNKVYLPMTELARITKYVGESSTELSSLEGKEWERTLSKTDEEIRAIAEDILETDAKRSLTTRIPFGRFEEEEERFRLAFPHVHTPDQRSIIDSIREDMEGPHPMDRLIAGDVGFGKTEVAMNAVYKAVLSGVQVAVISPLLILAEEHRETFEDRLGAFGVRVRSLTRMTHASEVKKILEEMKLGTVDVVVGTHRLLSEDIRFRRLGLLIIDEEHRFGVAQKEAIKKMKNHVDILSLSATPIPRSLHLALSGLKKISLLTTPPPRKKPIETLVTRWEEETVRQAIQSELARGGQVIILHNRIRSLPMIEREILELLGQISEEKMSGSSQKQEVRGRKDFLQGVYSQVNERKKSVSDDEIRRFSEFPKIITTHGQMHPDDIEDRILTFKEHRYDILLTTTIIENGVNFLGANTIIISDAEEFGLAQLHQIRGRVGRKDISGVCYLLYRKYELSSDERERLMILAEHSALGSGYEIAMRDMQMRGTGDILGFRQSGKTKEVGMSLYFQLLEEKIEVLRHGKKIQEQCKIDLELSYVIDDDEFDSEMDKLSFFRDIESIETLEDLDIAESTFRTDDMKEPMNNLFLMMRSSIILKGYGVCRVSKLGTHYIFEFSEGTTPDRLRGFLERFDAGKEMIIVSITRIKVDAKNWKGARELLLSLVK